MIKNSLVVLVSLLLSATIFGQSESKMDLLKKDADNARDAFIKDDPYIDRFFKESAGYVIFPNVGKAGIGIGGASGNGIVYTEGKHIGSAKMKQLTIGLQLGGQLYSEIIFFEKKEDMERFMGNKLEFSAQVSAVVLREGVSTDASYEHGVLVFTLAKKGLMYEASAGGQKFSYTTF